MPQKKSKKSSEVEGTLPLSELFKSLSEQQKNQMEDIVADLFCKVNVKSKTKGIDIMRSPFVRFKKDGTVIFLCSPDGFALCGKVPRLPAQAEHRRRIDKGDLWIRNAAFHIFDAINQIKDN